MYSNIHVDPDGISTIIANLNVEKENIKRVYENIQTDTKGMLEYWGGTTGELVNTDLSKDILVFDKIIQEIEDYIKFLDNMLVAYKIMDASIKAKMEENEAVQAY